jgi:hypothetical protein
MSWKLYSTLFLGVVCGIIIALVGRNFMRLNSQSILIVDRSDGWKEQIKQNITDIRPISPIVEQKVNTSLPLQSHNRTIETIKLPTVNQTSPLRPNTNLTSPKKTASKPATFPTVEKRQTINDTKSSCKYNFRVYVYPIPNRLRAIQTSEEARRNGTLHICHKCILEQFSLEYIVYDFFTTFCGRTYDPEEADFFYLPLIRDAEYRWALEMRLKNNRAPSNVEKALIDILEKNRTMGWKNVFQVTDSYWHRYQGGDHILVMPAPVTNFRHEGSKRGFFHYMMHLYPPIFLGLEYSKAFIDEYPVCSAEKNIVMPYPTTDPDLYNGKLYATAAASAPTTTTSSSSVAEVVKRSYLFYYAGGLHGDCIEVRKAMQRIMQNSSSIPNLVPHIPPGQAKREYGFLSSIFCPIPVGDSPSSKRMYDVLNFGCIPVVLSDDLIWAYSDQTNGPLNHTQFGIQLPQSIIQYSIERSVLRYANHRDIFGRLPISGIHLYDILLDANRTAQRFEQNIYINPLVHILRRIPTVDIEYLRHHGTIAAEHYRYYAMNQSMHRIPTADHVFPDGGAIEMLAHALTQRKQRGVGNILRDCLQERVGRKHKYIARYTCDTDSKDALHRRRRLKRSKNISPHSK